MKDLTRREFVKMTGALAVSAALTDFGVMEQMFAKADAAAVRRKLGFGMMRLPMMEAANPAHVVPANRAYGFDTSGKYAINVREVCRMVDKFIDSGFTYFDTSYVYLGGRSESVVHEALVKRHPRDSYTLATKLPTFAITEKAQVAQIFEEQLKKCGVDYFDYYLLHNIQNHLYDKYITPLGEFEYAKAQKDAGRIRNLGFSFHDSPELLDRILTEHPEVDFVQIALSYYDWDSYFVRSRRCYEVIRKHGKNVVVMQPVKGGTLANIPASAEQLMKEANPAMSPASWAIRFAAGLPGVIAVLSGMSSMEQMEDNASYMQEFKPLTKKELEVLNKVVPMLKESGPLHIADYSKYEGISPDGMPVAGVLDAYNSCQIQPDPTFSAENNYYKTFRFAAKIPEGESWVKGQLMDKDGNDVTDMVKKAESWLMENTF
ncbi:MAG: aldo/keto reductase [Selenomonadaceae bacterium]|nr:aldo/keto reductase [Selenomonadaceae bacterium]